MISTKQRPISSLRLSYDDMIKTHKLMVISIDASHKFS